MPTHVISDFYRLNAKESGLSGGLDLDACKGKGQASSPFEYACPLTEILLIGNLAVRCYDTKVLQPGKTPTSWAPYDYPGRVRLEWDAENMRVKNLEMANRYVGRGDR